MNGDMAFIQMGYGGIPHGNLAVVRNQNGHGTPLGLIVLAGNIQHSGADHVRHIHKQLGKALGIVLPVNICDVVFLLPLRLGIAHIIYIEAQGFG